MKSVNYFFKKAIVISLTTLLFFACTKEGPQGIPGPPGTAGSVGPAGKNGNSFLAGSGIPDSHTGDTGDYYLDKQTGNLYGPKNNNGWGNPVMLSGNSAGIILSGTGKPDSALGIEGDFYLDTTNYLLYGPKLINHNWGLGLMLKGTGGSSGLKSYVCTDPYDYIIDFDTIGTNGNNQFEGGDYGLSIPYNIHNHFDLWSDANNNNMIAVYLKRNPFSFDDDGQDTLTSEIIPANSTLEGSPTLDGYYLGSHYSVKENGLEIYFDNYIPRRMAKHINNELRGNWGDKNNFKRQTAIKSIIIFVISPSAVSDLPSLIGRISHQKNNNILQQLLKPYLN